jgi:transcription antitermination factor NusG
VIEGAVACEKPWFAVHVSSQHERLAIQVLQHKEYETFLPLYKVRRRWSDRFKIIEAPLFPGYIFCRIDPRNQLAVLTTPGVVQIVGFGKAPAPVEESEIAALRAIVNYELPAKPWPYLREGQRVRIEYGPLTGVEGILLKFKNQHRLVASVTLLQRSVAVELDDDWVSPAPNQQQ